MSYRRYYQKGIDLGINGYKPVLGGTGLGKTHGILEVVKANPVGRKFIYVSHRHNLLEEMAEKLSSNGIQYAYLKRDPEIIRSIFESDTKPNELLSLLNDPVFEKYRSYLDDTKGDWRYKLSTLELNRKRLKRFIEIEKTSSTEEIELLGLEDDINQLCSYTLKFFKGVCYLISEVKELLDKKKPKTDYSNHDFHDQDQKILLAQHSILLELFPYWDYLLSKDKPILLVTVQKLFSGFFSGSRNLNVYKLKDKVIFLDEFEFLEPVLLKSIIAESKLDDPFVFIAYFYHNISIKRLDDKYLGHDEEIKERIEYIWKRIDRLKKGFYFPDIRFFAAKDEAILKELVGTGIYQANFTTVDRPIYLEADHALQKYWLINKKEKDSLTTFHLMGEIKKIANSILQFFLYLRSEREDLHDELLEDAFQKTDFIGYIKSLGFYSLAPLSTTKKERKWSSFSHLYHKGYGVYILKKPKTEAEPDEIKLDLYMVNSSPEKCLLGLIKNNFVFGLSATSKIPRYIEHFNTDWIKEEIEFDADESVRFIELDAEDNEILKKLTEDKALKRKNFLKVERASTECDTITNRFATELKTSYDYPYVSGPSDYQKDRLKYFFNALDWIKLNPMNKTHTVDSHLIFLNSLRQVAGALRTLQESPHKYQQLIVLKNIAYHYEITYQGSRMWVLLLDSKSHSHYFDTSNGKLQYQEIFNTGLQVIVVTQYPSANNGVNLQYENHTLREKDKAEDFQTIHLLEAPHFYFSSKDEKSADSIKSDIWKLSQLSMSKKIDRVDFGRYIRQVAKPSSGLNTMYKSTNDYVLNQIAKIIQALGRVERVRDKGVGLQRVRVGNGVVKVLNNYFHKREISTIVTEASQYYSNFIHIFFAEAYKFCKKPNFENRPESYPQVREANANCEKALDGLLSKVAAVQNGSLKDKEARAFITYWNELRETALRLDFPSKTLFNSSATVYLEKGASRGEVLLNKETGDMSEDYSLESNENYQLWRFNSVYKPLLVIEEVIDYFSKQNFSLEFKDFHNFRYFAPIFYQRIYLGALGEAACKAMFLMRNKPIEVRFPHERDKRLFEVADFYIPSLDWFVDAKFYSEKNIKGLAYISGAKTLVDKIKSEAPKKLKQIRELQPEAKLVIVNSYSDNEGHTSFFDSNFNIALTEEGCDVIVFPGLMQLKKFLNQISAIA